MRRDCGADKLIGVTSTSALLLREVLRRRRELPVEEVALLLARLPAGWDGSESAVKSGSWLNVLQIVVNADNEEPPSAWIGRSIGEWPAWTLEWAETAEVGEGGKTMLGAAATVFPSAGVAGGKAGQLARLIYELLGGHPRSTGELSPLPAVAEEANQVLRQAVRGRFADGTAFLHAWERSVAEQLAAHRARELRRIGDLRIPRWLLEKAERGVVLRLIPADEDGVPIHLVARTEFRLGRSRSQSDFPVRLRAAGEEDLVASKHLSRVHVLVERVGAELTVRDGNGERPSVNGSNLNGTTLDAGQPLPLVSGVLTLGPAGRGSQLSVQLLPEALGDVRIANLADWHGSTGNAGSASDEVSESLVDGLQRTPAAAPVGAVAFQPLEEQPLLRDAVWLFADVGFELLIARANFIWSDEAGAPLRFLHRHGAFWLARLGGDCGAVRVDEGALEPGQIAPLVSGQCLELGLTRFTLAVE